MDITDEARILARQYTSRLGLPPDMWGKFYGVVWEALVECDRKGLTGHTRNLTVRRRMVDEYRRETGYRRKRRGSSYPELYNDLGDFYGDSIPDQRVTHKTPLGLWVEWSRERKWTNMATRVMAYLYVVEGWVMQEIGDYFGVTDSTVSYALKLFTENAVYARSCVLGTGKWATWGWEPVILGESSRSAPVPPVSGATPGTFPAPGDPAL